MSPSRKKNIALALLTLSLTIIGCQKTAREDIPEVTQERGQALDEGFQKLLAKHNIITAGVGIIKDGKLVWTGYYGDEKQGKPASENTLFNVASITKTVTTETILRLADAGKLSLDEQMYRYWVDPDIKEDPRHKELTPQMALTHSTGFRNWRFFSDDNTLRFINDPGSTYGYSGEGFEYVARFAEEKLGKPFDQLVQEEVFIPFGIQNASMSVDTTLFANMARAEDDEGNFHGYYCRPNGWCREHSDFSAADDLVVTVKAHAKFLIAAMNGNGYSKSIQDKRNQVHSNTTVVDCSLMKEQPCPEKQGYGLGWRVLDYGSNNLISHGGSDWSEVALTYFYTESKDGIIIFFNAPMQRGIEAMPGAIELIDPDSPMAVHYRMRSR